MTFIILKKEILFQKREKIETVEIDIPDIQ